MKPLLRLALGTNDNDQWNDGISRAQMLVICAAASSAALQDPSITVLVVGSIPNTGPHQVSATPTRTV